MWTPWLCRSSDPGSGDPANQYHQGPGNSGKPPIDGDQHASAASPATTVQRLVSPRWRKRMPQLLIGMALARRDAEQFRQLLDHDAQRHAKHKAFEHRLGDEVRNETEL